MRKSNIIFRFLILISFITGSCYLAPYIEIDNSVERWLPKNSKKTILYKQFLNDFNSDALLILTFENLIPTHIEEEVVNRMESLKKEEHVIKVSTWPINNIRHKKKKNNNIRTYVVRFKPKSHLNPNRPDLIDKINDLFVDLGDGFHLAGTGVIHHAINQQTEKALGNNLLVGLFLLLVVLIVLIRSPIVVMQTIFVSLGGISSIIYISVIFNIPFSLAHTIIPIIVLFYGTSISLHIIFHSGNFQKVFIPTTIVVITTSIGFSIFLFDKVPLLRDFASLGLAGLSGAYICSIILFYPKVYEYKVSEKIRYQFKKIPVPKRAPGILIYIVVMVLLIPGLLKITPEIHSLSVLSKENKAYKDHLFIESKVGNYFPIEYIIDEHEVDRKSVSLWVNNVYELEEIGGVITYYQLPKTLNKRNLGYQSKVNKNIFRITFMAPLLSTSKGILLANDIQFISKKYFDNWLPELTGFITLYANVSEGLITSFRQSLIIAFMVIPIIIILYLRDIKMVLLALLANCFPIVSMLGLMGWAGINLDMVTIPIGCLLFSIVVDDTIHIMYWYKTTKDIRESISQAGPGIFYTTLILGLGFSVLLISDAPPVRFFGVLSLFALITALIGDMILLPSLLNNGRK